MKQSAKSKFSCEGWTEDSSDASAKDQLLKLTAAKSRQIYVGEMQGSSSMDSLILYQSEGIASYVAIERFHGELKGQRGSFALRHVGSYSNGWARAEIVIIEGSGTDELMNIEGQTTFSAEHADLYDFELHYSLLNSSNS